MNSALKTLRKTAEDVGVAFARPETIRQLSLDRRDLFRMQSFLSFLRSLSPEAMAAAVEMFPGSRGENFQDIFAVLVLGSDRKGFFVEFGATDGVHGSNTYLMEKSFGWHGLLAEPARGWQSALQDNRTAAISHKCVWREGGRRVAFREAEDGGFSTLEEFWARDRHAEKRRFGKVYEVVTTTLEELLKEHDAPALVDYLSIDTEGSEYDILSTSNFDQREILVLTIEHNNRPERDKIFSLMTERGYVRAPTAVSLFDDWYVRAELSGRMREIFRREAWGDSA